MRVELINTGTELLLGTTLNTHVRFLAQSLQPLGLRIERQVAVPDGEAIREALKDGMTRAEIVIVTGGLGPTTDDLTREITAELLGLDLIHDREIMRHIRERFARRGLTCSPRNRRQARRPHDATVLWNPHGTAPGLHILARGVHIFLLPGPPRELYPMVRDHVVPILEKVLPPREAGVMKTFRIAALGESAIEQKVGRPLLSLGIELGYCAHPREVEIRLIGPEKLVARGERIIRRKLGPEIISDDGSTLEKVIVDLLAVRGGTVATAESCTGGHIANRLTNVPGASRVFLAGHVTYANEAKTRELAVPAKLIARHGAVSEPVARAMAEGARKKAGVDFAIATTGIAGPDGGSAEKPTGTVFIAIAARGRRTVVERHFFPTDREHFKVIVTATALDLLRRAILAECR